jgi:hypothetical protein
MGAIGIIMGAIGTITGATGAKNIWVGAIAGAIAGAATEAATGGWPWVTVLVVVLV